VGMGEGKGGEGKGREGRRWEGRGREESVVESKKILKIDPAINTVYCPCCRFVEACHNTCRPLEFAKYREDKFTASIGRPKAKSF